MSVGRLEEKKNTKRIIQAFDEFCKTTGREYQLVLIGNPGYGYEDVVRAVECSSYKNRIIFAREKNADGHVSMQDVYTILSKAELHLYPSLYEGFGIPILEAFACGTPVVTSNMGSMSEVGGDACEYVDPMQVSSIVSGMKKIIDDPEYSRLLVDRGQQRAKDFSWERCARQTFEVITK